jgi:hypothetical protein
MPRDPKVVTIQKLTVATANYEAALKAVRQTAVARNKAVRAALEAGNSKAQVARTAGTAPARIYQILAEVD